MNRFGQGLISDLGALPKWNRIVDLNPPLTGDAAKSLLAIDLVDGRIAILHAPGRSSVTQHDLTALRDRLVRDSKVRSQGQAQPVIVLRVAEHLIADLKLHSETKKQAAAEAAVMDEESVYRDTFRDLIARAVNEGVSDVHFERQGDEAQVRFHRPGGMQVVRSLSGSFMLRMCKMVYDTIAEDDAKEIKFNEALPQKARVTLNYEQFRAELRVQTVPAFPGGADMIVRILAVVRHADRAASKAPPTLKDAGYLPQAQRFISDAVAMPNGILVLSGTVNSGKSTTIANVVRRLILDSDGLLKVMTLEDPPESTIIGATQVPIEQVRAALKFKGDADPETNAYAEGIKIALRSDIHKLVVGEIRGAEMALPLTHAVRSGHYTFTTIHAGSAVEAVSRMIDLGVKAEDLSSPGFLNATVYQRLLPGLCPHCSREEGDFPEVIRPLVSEMETFSRAYLRQAPRWRWRNPMGCEHCTGGVTRRLLVAEVLFPDDEMRLLIRKRQMLELRDAWLSSGAHPVAHHVLLRCAAGEVDPYDMVQEGVRWTDLRDWVRMANDRHMPVSLGADGNLQTSARRRAGASVSVLVREANTALAEWEPATLVSAEADTKLVVRAAQPYSDGASLLVLFSPDDTQSEPVTTTVLACRVGNRAEDAGRPVFIVTLQKENAHV